MNMYLEKDIDSDVVSIVKRHLNEDRGSNKNLIRIVGLKINIIMLSN